MTKVVDCVNIRSIDLQVLIPRSAEVSRVQQVTDQQNALQQQQHAAEWKQITADRQHQVQSTPKNAGGKVGEKAREESKHNRRDQDKNKDSAGVQSDAPEQSHDASDPVRGHHVDIKT